MLVVVEDHVVNYSTTRSDDVQKSAVYFGVVTTVK
jgi:hypothetical protein